MTVEVHIKSEYAVLLSHRIVHSVEMVKYIVNHLNGYLRVRCVLTNDDFLEVALHLCSQAGQVVTDSYRYQWMDSTHTTLRRRWDNAPHYPDLQGFPHHCHVEHEDNVESASLMDITHLLNFITDNIT
ncbi:DUF6516 family protein [soil metagenome]